MRRRQTSLRPEQGGKFHRPVGAPLPPTVSDVAGAIASRLSWKSNAWRGDEAFSLRLDGRAPVGFRADLVARPARDLHTWTTALVNDDTAKAPFVKVDHGEAVQLKHAQRDATLAVARLFYCGALVHDADPVREAVHATPERFGEHVHAGRGISLALDGLAEGLSHMWQNMFESLITSAARSSNALIGDHKTADRVGSSPKPGKHVLQIRGFDRIRGRPFAETIGVMPEGAVDRDLRRSYDTGEPAFVTGRWLRVESVSASSDTPTIYVALIDESKAAPPAMPAGYSVPGFVACSCRKMTSKSGRPFTMRCDPCKREAVADAQRVRDSRGNAGGNVALLEIIAGDRGHEHLIGRHAISQADFDLCRRGVPALHASRESIPSVYLPVVGQGIVIHSVDAGALPARVVARYTANFDPARHL